MYYVVCTRTETCACGGVPDFRSLSLKWLESAVVDLCVRMQEKNHHEFSKSESSDAYLDQQGL